MFTVNPLSVVRLQEELDICSKKLDQSFSKSHYEKQHSSLTVLANDLNIKCSNVDDSTLKEIVVNNSISLIKMTTDDQSFTAEQLEKTGLQNAIAANAQLLSITAKMNRRYITNETLTMLRGLSKRDSCLQKYAEYLTNQAVENEELAFFSPFQMRHDYDLACAEFIQSMKDVSSHNTNWSKVASGALSIATGLVGKAGGAIACASGAGCVLGAVAIVGGTKSIISGAMEVADGLNED